MSTGSKVNSISKRKQDHLTICKQNSGHTIEGAVRYSFDCLEFVHHALPELDVNTISQAILFLGKRVRLPLFISCMTGGSVDGYRANRELALAAQNMQIPIGLGSMRVLFSEPERVQDFALRSLAPDVPIFGNIGAVQLRDSGFKAIHSWLERLELDALVIHLNCGQELFQREGDRDFSCLLSTIEDAIETLNIPIIVKETGFGIRPRLVKKLIDIGVTYVDLAGSGGTNWILVENEREHHDSLSAKEFASWGIPTPCLLDATRCFSPKILASGGIRSGMDIAKALALGAYAVGMALPFIRLSLEGGRDAVSEKIYSCQKSLQAVQALAGCKTIEDLRNQPLIRTADFEHYVSSLKTIDCIS